MCWWPSSANVLPWREVFTKFYRFSASRFSRKCPFYRRSKHSTPNRTYSITLTSSFFSTSNRTGMSPNDLVYKSDGSLYFTDPHYGLPTQEDNDPQKELR